MKVLSLEDSNICNRQDRSITNFYPDFKLYSLSYINVNSPLKDGYKNRKVYHQNIRGLKGKISQLSNIYYIPSSHVYHIQLSTTS
jgi:hypothetical protein